MNATAQPPPTDPWAPGVRAADVPVSEGGEPDPLEDSSDEFETTAAPLYPNKVDINRHLFELFSPAFVRKYPDAQVEIAYANPATDEGPRTAKPFSVFDLQKAADFAEEMSKVGRNVYVGAALRDAQVKRQGEQGTRRDIFPAAGPTSTDRATTRESELS